MKFRGGPSCKGIREVALAHHWTAKQPLRSMAHTQVVPGRCTQGDTWISNESTWCSATHGQPIGCDHSPACTRGKLRLGQVLRAQNGARDALGDWVAEHR
jgi:hypothetical protein